MPIPRYRGFCSELKSAAIVDEWQIKIQLVKLLTTLFVIRDESAVSRFFLPGCHIEPSSGTRFAVPAGPQPQRGVVVGVGVQRSWFLGPRCPLRCHSLCHNAHQCGRPRIPRRPGRGDDQHVAYRCVSPRRFAASRPCAWSFRPRLLRNVNGGA